MKTKLKIQISHTNFNIQINNYTKISFPLTFFLKIPFKIIYDGEKEKCENKQNKTKNGKLFEKQIEFCNVKKMVEKTKHVTIV